MYFTALVSATFEGSESASNIDYVVSSYLHKQFWQFADGLHFRKCLCNLYDFHPFLTIVLYHSSIPNHIMWSHLIFCMCPPFISNKACKHALANSTSQYTYALWHPVHLPFKFVRILLHVPNTIFNVSYTYMPVNKPLKTETKEARRHHLELHFSVCLHALLSQISHIVHV